MKVLKTSRITFQRKADPPSIPSPGKAYGYEEAPDGSLRPQEIPNRDSSMGPAYYNVNHVSLRIKWLHSWTLGSWPALHIQ